MTEAQQVTARSGICSDVPGYTIYLYNKINLLIILFLIIVYITEKEGACHAERHRLLLDLVV